MLKLLVPLTREERETTIVARIACVYGVVGRKLAKLSIEEAQYFREYDPKWTARFELEGDPISYRIDDIKQPTPLDAHSHALATLRGHHVDIGDIRYR